jgi:hypothetical protein
VSWEFQLKLYPFLQTSSFRDPVAQEPHPALRLPVKTRATGALDEVPALPPENPDPAMDGSKSRAATTAPSATSNAPHLNFISVELHFPLWAGIESVDLKTSEYVRLRRL